LGMIYACEHHDDVLALWRRQDLKGIRLAHVDFHDDLQGLIVNRRRGLAFARNSLLKAKVHPGNFLAKAVVERRLDAVRWVHDIPGGRGWDFGVVKYTSDPSVMLQRIRHGLPSLELPFEFQELLMRRWCGPAPGERMSVDWDCFASILQAESTISDRVDSFVTRLGDHVPVDSYVCFSPDYSHIGSLPAFLQLVELLARRYGQHIEWLAPGLEHGHLNPEGIDTSLPSDWRSQLRLWLRHKGLW